MKKFQLGKYKGYVWKGTNKWGQKAMGVIVAENDARAEEEARLLGMPIHSLTQRHFLLLPGAATNQTRVIDIVLMMRQLTTLISAGIPLVQALEIIAVGVEKVRFRALLLTIRDDIANGKTFSDALQPYPYFFNQLICGLVQAGEQSGTLDKMVTEVALYLERQEYLKNRVKRAMYYPITMVSIAALVIVAMLIFIVPRFEKIYASFHAKLPAFTQKIMSLSQFIRHDWWLVIIIVIGFMYGFQQLNEKSTRFQYWRDALSIKIFIFGALAKKAIISRICSTLAVTLAAGIPLMDALNRVAKISQNHWYRDAMLMASEEVAQGESISMAMRGTQLFPPLVTQMIEIGEKSGSLDMMFSKVGEYYRDQVNTAVEGLTTIIEPLLIVIVGAIVGVFIIAMYLPIFNLGMAIK